MRDGVPLLFPTGKIKYDKSKDVHYSDDGRINSYLAKDVHDNPLITANPLYEIYGCIFDKHYIVSCASLGSQMVFCLGHKRNRQPVHMGCLIPVTKYRYILNFGMKVKSPVMLSHGVLDQEDVSSEENMQECVKSLYKKNKHRMKIINPKDDPRPYVFEFFDSNGNSFHKEYELTTIKEVKVTQNAAYYFMELQE